MGMSRAAWPRLTKISSRDLPRATVSLTGRVALRFIGSPRFFLASLRYGNLVAAVTSFTVIRHQASGVVGCLLSD
jgi:hypothetical protein